MEFETKGRKMSWLEKSAGIVMSEIILGNAGVCCKGPGTRQFITSVGSGAQPAHVHTDTAVPPASPPCAGGVGGLPSSRRGKSLRLAGGSSVGRRGKRARSCAEVAWSLLVAPNSGVGWALVFCCSNTCRMWVELLGYSGE